MSYDFKDMNDLTQVSSENKPVEGFAFGDFYSANENWWLLDRSAPTPDEKEVTEDIPYSQGILDFSALTGDRYFANREITYQLLSLSDDYQDRKVIENELKRRLTTQLTQALVDTHEPGLHWIGKVKSVTVEDDSKFGTLKATIVFNCYPFAIGNDAEGSDIWDDVFFPNWVFQDTSFEVSGTQNINLINIGSHTAELKITVTGTVTVSGSFGSIKLTAGTYTDTQVTLAVGENQLTLSGTGTINFEFYKEVMI